MDSSGRKKPLNGLPLGSLDGLSFWEENEAWFIGFGLFLFFMNNKSLEEVEVKKMQMGERSNLQHLLPQAVLRY